MPTLPIYLDYSSTTPIDPHVQAEMLPYMTDNFGNPASRSHSFGWTAENAVERAREQVAASIGADPREIIWTSGATESDNLALKGAAHFYREKGRHIITVRTEHKAVLDSCRHLETEGYRLTYLTPHPNGLIDLPMLEAAVESDTILISVMHVNNEIGVIQPIEEIGAFCRERGILFHVDAAQTIGKITLNVQTCHASLVSLSAHKAYGPKGIGALYVRRKPRVRLTPMIHGGGHERGLRSGTLSTPQIVGMGAAYAYAIARQEEEVAHIRKLQDRFLSHIQNIPEIQINGDLKKRIPHNLNVSFKFVEGESLMMALKNIAVSSGSACTSASLEPSYVLKALGCPDELAHSSIRFTFGRFTTQEDIDFACTLIQEKVAKLRQISPLWEMHLKGIDVANFDWKASNHHEN